MKIAVYSLLVLLFIAIITAVKRKQARLNAYPGSKIPFGETWVCAICGKRRPGMDISVAVKPIFMGDQQIGQHTIKYCNDSDSCTGAALNTTGIHQRRKQND